MSERPGSLPAARIERRRRLSAIWIIPAITVLIAIWLAWNTLSQRGPLITINFESAEGLTAGQSQVRYKDIPLGTVESIKLAPDYSHVIVAARMKRDATRLLTDKARFWVVKPRLAAGNLSGFETILSGSYIAVLPSIKPGEPMRHFAGLETPPVLQTNVPGHTFLLHADRVGSLNPGSPVFYRGLDVGTVLGWDLGRMAQTVTVHAFVRAPFDDYVHQGSRFWNASGVSVTLGASGVKVDFQSLRAVLLGGIAFDTPVEAESTPVATANETFPLYENHAAADSARYRKHIDAVAYFPGSVSGLAPGAPVTMLGIRIGEVTSVDLRYNREKDILEVPVHFSIQPGRIALSEAAQKRGPLRNAQILVNHGMRAELATANLLTGQQEVALAFDHNAPAATVTVENGTLVIPTAPGSLSGITQSAAALLDKVNHMPFQEIGDNLNATLAGLSKLANSEALRQSLTSLKTTLADAQQAIGALNHGAGPALARLPTIATDLRSLLARTSMLVSSVETTYGGNSKFYRDLDRLLLQTNELMQSVRALSDLLAEQPNALIRGRSLAPRQ
ncbi:MAG: intermembrane transport protein PqiB [Acetobacteraceae bacterium]